LAPEGILQPENCKEIKHGKEVIFLIWKKSESKFEQKLRN
jgi:hypothetical protein